MVIMLVIIGSTGSAAKLIQSSWQNPGKIVPPQHPQLPEPSTKKNKIILTTKLFSIFLDKLIFVEFLSFRFPHLETPGGWIWLANVTSESGLVDGATTQYISRCENASIKSGNITSSSSLKIYTQILLPRRSKFL